MKLKRILTIVLLVFVVGSLAYMVGRERGTEPDQNEVSVNPIGTSKEKPATPNEPVVVQENDQSILTNIETEAPKQDSQLIVYYLHGDMRCPTCHKLETYAKEALDTYFADEVASKDIVWKVINVDKPENRHFVQDYRLVTKSVVLSEITDGKENRWKNLDLIWQKVGDKGSYLQYIRDSILKFLQDTES